MRLGATALSPEEALEVKLAAESEPARMPILKTAPRVNGTNGPTLAPDGNGGIAPTFVPVDFEPLVHCVPGWTGPDCRTRIGEPTGLPTGVEQVPPGTIVPSEVTRFAPIDAPPAYKMENGVPVLTAERAEVEKGFLIGPIAIAAAVTVGLVVLMRDRK